MSPLDCAVVPQNQALTQTMAYSDLWQKLRGSVLILTGTGSRMVSALVYFLLLVNGLSLEDYGVFISILASALIISNGGTYGFMAPTFRAQTEKAYDREAYFGGLILYALVWLPITFLAAIVVYLLLFSAYASLTTMLLIIAGEAIFMRVLAASYELNIATNRYGFAAAINLFSVIPRIFAVVLFMAVPDHGLADWAVYFCFASFVSMIFALLLIPRIRPRFSVSVLKTGFREAMSQEGVTFVQSVQVELDKVIVLVLAGPVAAGIYNISMRIIYVVSEPIRSLFPLVAQHFIRNVEQIQSWRRQIILEVGLIASCLGAYLGLLVVLSFKPGLLGENVEAGFAFFSLLPVVFATKILPEYHKTLLYGARRLHKAVWVAFSITVTKMFAIYLIAISMPFPQDWAWALNLLFLALYIQSLLATWGWAMRDKTSIEQ